MPLPLLTSVIFIPRFQISGKNCPSIAGLPEKDSERLKRIGPCWLSCRSDSSDQSKGTELASRSEWYQKNERKASGRNVGLLGIQRSGGMKILFDQWGNLNVMRMLRPVYANTSALPLKLRKASVISFVLTQQWLKLMVYDRCEGTLIRFL